MKSKLLIVADLGLVKAYKLDFTLNHTPRLEQLEEVVLEEARGRVLDKVTDEIREQLPPAVCKRNQEEPIARPDQGRAEGTTRSIP
jgi:hypothetical protein